MGLEISTICITDLKSNTAYALDLGQTIDIEGATWVEQYAQHVVDLAANLGQLNSRYLAADAYVKLNSSGHLTLSFRAQI
ncbi:MAG: hypothetical protein ACJAYB_002969 [Psychromonas sp.]